MIEIELDDTPTNKRVTKTEVDPDDIRPIELDALACRLCGLDRPLNDDSVCAMCFGASAHKTIATNRLIPPSAYKVIVKGEPLAERTATIVEGEHAGKTVSIPAPHFDGADLTDDLKVIGGEAKKNADAKALGSMRGGELRGVGFSTKEGYVDALAHGVKYATAMEYKRILLTTYKMPLAEVDALTTTIIEESDLPVGKGIVHEARDAATSLSNDRVRGDQLPHIIAHRKRAEAERAKVAEAAAEKEKARMAVATTIIAGVETAASGELIGWSGLGDITNKRMKELGAEWGIPKDWMLDPESAKLQASRSVNKLKSKGIVISPTNKENEIEKHGAEAVTYLSRWTVGRVNHSESVKDGLGKKLVVATLEADGSLTLEGDAEMCRTVRTEFDRRTATEVHKSTDITRWLGTTLRFRLSAVRYGSLGWYVPAPGVAMAHKLCTMLACTGWGTEWVGTTAPAAKPRTCPMATSEGLLDGIAIGLADEVDAELETLETRREAIRSGSSDNAEKDVGPRGAATYLAKLRVLLERIASFGAWLGEERTGVLAERVRQASLEVAEQAEGSDLIQRFDLIFEELRDEKLRAERAEAVS